MVRGQDIHATTSIKEAKKRGYEYFNKRGEKLINRAGYIYFDQNYITIDHKINKARCPQKMFDFDNLQAVCWRCNWEKSDDNIVMVWSVRTKGKMESTKQSEKKWQKLIVTTYAKK